MKLLILYFIVSVTVVAAKEIGVRTYDGYDVLSVRADSPSQFELLKQLVLNEELDFWTSPKYQDVTDIMVSPEQKDLIIALFSSEEMKWSVKIFDVGRLIRDQKVENSLLGSETNMTWTVYHRYVEIVKWLESISTNPLVTLTVIGKSSEAREIHQVQISSGRKENGELKPAIFIDALFHAREWVSGASATWIINEIISNPTKYESILSKFDFFIVPMVNPDGYEFSHTSQRFWRKTRSKNSGSSCYGCDPNRNFAFHFGGEGTSSNPCSEVYKGENAFSEPETAAVSVAIKKLQSERVVHAYFTLHSYGQLWLLSWGYTRGAYPPDFAELLKWGKSSVEAIKGVHGQSYIAGQAADLLYGVGGASDDWAKNEGIKYVATLEVRDRGAYGFALPPSQIIPTAEEIWGGIQFLETTIN